MGIFDKLVKKPTNNSLPTPFTSQITYKGIAIEIGCHIEESKNQLSGDYAALERDGIEKIIRNRFIPWFKTEEFIDRDTYYTISDTFEAFLANMDAELA